ncbi:hypothetical protein [Ekhidna sp.]|uniref:hypothetical protein n=1 Tax=Ekhidna sp. TaxID=2608089 RepID=UPI003B50F1AC
MKRIILITLAYSLCFTTWANRDDETRTAIVKVEISPSDKINIQAKYTELSIETWDKNEVLIEASVRFDGKMTNKIQEFLDEFESRVQNNIKKGGNELLIDTDLDLPNKIQIGSKHVGINVSYGDDDLKISYKIKAPGKNKYTISNSYEELRMIGSYRDVSLTQYSGELDAEYIEKANMNLKYGTATIDEIGEAKFEIYEQELDINEIETLDINAKYSDLEFGKTGTIDAIAYETDFIINNAKALSGNFKYGKIEIAGTLGTGEFECYELDMEIAEAGALLFTNSKYSKLRSGSVQKINYYQSYEDETRIDKLDAFMSTNSKYGKHTIGKLNGPFELNAYEDEITINELGNRVDRIEIKGKYIDATIDINNSSFNLKGNVKYGKVNYDEDQVDVRRYIKDGDQLELEIVSKNSKSSTPTEIRVDGYEIKISLE